DRFQQRLFTHEMNIGIDREARRRQETAQGRHIVAVETEPVGELEPARDAAFALPASVMIDQTTAPFTARSPILAARDQARILDWDHRLVIVAIECPGLHLALGAGAAMQQFVERVQAVVTALADITQARFEFLRGQDVHSTISMPSSATSYPAASTFRRCGEPSRRIGLVLLI